MSPSFARFVPLALLVAATYSPDAEACSFVSGDAGVGVVSKLPYDLPPLPRNVAFFWQQSPVGSPVPAEGVTVAQGPDGEAILAYAALDAPSRNRLYLVRPSEPLPANSAFSVYRYGSLVEQYRTSDYLDETPPERPSIATGALIFHDGTQGCGQDSCGDYTSLSFELERPVSDDRALAENMVYALYFGESEAEVRTASTPYAFVWGFGLNVDNTWMDRDAFIAVSALDHAGNESARSEPFRVNAGSDGGCSVQSRSTRRVSGTLFLLAFGFALLRRARRR
jgi:hypothetical protein